jgi:hypothetical protein
MNFRAKKLSIILSLLSASLSISAAHYINNSGEIIIVTNVAAKKRTKKSCFSFSSKKNYVQTEDKNTLYFIELEDGAEGDLDNNQGDEVTIESVGIIHKRKIFPTNNSFNYVITINKKYNNKFQKIEINHA